MDSVAQTAAAVQPAPSHTNPDSSPQRPAPPHLNQQTSDQAPALNSSAGAAAPFKRQAAKLRKSGTPPAAGASAAQPEAAGQDGADGHQKPNRRARPPRAKVQAPADSGAPPADLAVQDGSAPSAQQNSARAGRLPSGGRHGQHTKSGTRQRGRGAGTSATQPQEGAPQYAQSQFHHGRANQHTQPAAGPDADAWRHSSDHAGNIYSYNPYAQQYHTQQSQDPQQYQPHHHHHQYQRAYGDHQLNQQQAHRPSSQPTMDFADASTNGPSTSYGPAADRHTGHGRGRGNGRQAGGRLDTTRRGASAQAGPPLSVQAKPFTQSQRPARQADSAPEDSPVEPAATLSDGPLDAADDGGSSDGDTLMCVVCCEEVGAVVTGACGHNQVCARCCLRLRMCYKDTRCPLCKAVNDEIVVARPPQPDQQAATYEALMKQRDQLWQKPNWARGVLVYDPPELAVTPGGRRHGRPLQLQLMVMTARSCGVCDKHGRKPFPTDKMLQEHLTQVHSARLCGICLQAGLKFTLELPVLKPVQMKQHMHDHPSCQFCHQHFYGRDELFSHMTQRHFTCHVCQREGHHHMYFQDADMLQVHFRENHHVCEEPECIDCFIAFSTLDELRQHQQQRHSSHMPRWNQSRARPLILDFVPSRDRNGLPSGPGAASERPPRRGRRDQQQQQQHAADALQGVVRDGSPGGMGAPLVAGPAPAALGDQQEAVGGLAVIDDHLGEELAAGAGTPAVRSVAPVLSGAWAGRNPSAANRPDDFPTLQAGPGVGAGSQALASAWQRPAHMALRKVTARCYCGRKESHLAVREDEEVPELKCDRECDAQQRRNQLASAFGVENPQEHVSHFERHRHANYAPQLLQAAQDYPEWLEVVERELSAFLADTSQRKHALLAMSQSQRALVHELAGQYGIATHSVGQGSQRCVHLLKTPSSGVPQRLLSTVAAGMSREEVARLLAAVPNYTLRLVDIAPDANLAHYLQIWAGDYTLKRDSSTTASLVFQSEATLKDCSAVLAGGVRGVFRVDRSTAAGHCASAASTGSGSSASRTAGQGTSAPSSRQAAAAAAPAPGWQVFKAKKGAGKKADGLSRSALNPLDDPWASDDEKEAARKAIDAAARAAAPEDWEDAGEVSVSRLMLGAPVQLQQHNIWQALNANE